MRSFWKITFINSPEKQGKLLLIQNDEITMSEDYKKFTPLSRPFWVYFGAIFFLMPMTHSVPLPGNRRA